MDKEYFYDGKAVRDMSLEEAYLVIEAMMAEHLYWAAHPEKRPSFGVLETEAPKGEGLGFPSPRVFVRDGVLVDELLVKCP